MLLRPRLHWLSLLSWIPPLVALELAAQSSIITLTSAHQVILEPFSQLSGIRELTSERAIVVDKLERAVYIVDWDAGTRQTVGRTGSGPGEYLMPSSVLASGDSTLI